MKEESAVPVLLGISGSAPTELLAVIRESLAAILEDKTAAPGKDEL